jgi:(p)ppGpp synthase/HD superfamily hydrolase
MAAAAVLHDVIEDTPVGPTEIERRFGPNVLRMVVGLTKVPVPGNRAKRKAAERERLAAEAADVQTIKCLDMVSNLPSIMQHDPNFAKTYIREVEALREVLTKADERAQFRLGMILL